MRSKNTFGIQFFSRKKHSGKAELSYLYARITVNKRRVEISLKKQIDPMMWDDKRGQAKTRYDEGRNLNLDLEHTRASIAQCYHELDKGQKIITAEMVKSLFLGEEKQEHTLLNLATYHNTRFKETLAEGTLKNYFTTVRYLKRFLKEKKKLSDIHLSELNYSFIVDFENYLRAHVPTDHQKKLTNNGVMKHLERLRKLSALAVRLEWLDREPFARYQLKFKKVDKSFLTTDELAQIESKAISIERLQYIRDLFVFACYTGLAYSDAMSLEPGHIQRGQDGKLWIRTSRQKTNVSVTTPLLPEAQEIMEKYKDHPRSRAFGKIFPPISNQRLNTYLKELADICGIDKHLTFHLARHTFATSVTLANGVPIETVSKMLGHTKIATTQIYARVLEKKISEDMERLFRKRESETNVRLGGK
ncbi:MAG: site-specific integrase [Mucilaginibacter polytrichastri]|nr:site-specific integrase [Mucilaginibacter polytrichastri]